MKTMNTKTIWTTLFFCFAMVSLSVAQERRQPEKKQPPTFAQLLEEMDKNEDGKLSKAEIKGPLKKDFAKVDLDEDGFITAAEFKKAPKPSGEKPQNGN